MNSVIQICRLTFTEIIRSKVLYLVLAFAVVLVGVSSAFANVTIGDPLKTIKDFGLFSISLFGLVFVSISGSLLLSKELQRKTIYNILSRPIHRSFYLLGKGLGLWAASAALSLSMIAALYLYTLALGDQPSSALLVSGCYMLLDLVTICSVLILLSSVFVTPFLSGLICFCLCVAGRFTSHLEYFAKDGTSWTNAITLALPRFDLTNINNSTVYGTIPTTEHFFNAFLYSASYSGLMIILAVYAFKRRDFN